MRSAVARTTLLTGVPVASCHDHDLVVLHALHLQAPRQMHPNGRRGGGNPHSRPVLAQIHIPQLRGNRVRNLRLGERKLGRLGWQRT